MVHERDYGLPRFGLDVHHVACGNGPRSQARSLQ